MKIVPAAILLGLGSVGVGGWYKFSNLKPKTLRQYLEWQGLRLISDSETNYWKAVIEENGKLISDLSISGVEEVKSWCNRHIDSPNYEDFKDSASLLCVDNPRTVKARIIQLYGDTSRLIQSGNDEDKQYKVAYVFRKHIDGFHSLIGYSPEIGEDGKEVEDLDAAKSAFKEWCTSSLSKAVDETLVLNVKELCIPKKFSSIKELIEQRGESTLLLTSGNNSIDLQSKHESIKGLASWKADNEKNGETQEDLKDWCEKNESKNFSDSKVFSEVYPKFRFRCLKNSEGQPQ
ncbi:hypothetical protein HF1_10200 [Mycoplasma haemofelis str. Langford 1]|uniref:Uncharacterized protein n=1 Tax=Mycoplasma haemofelis (strain Langford 1) TaxID=941640 RepID=E8ZIQ7_MYCHL|nr:hypothetical protein [Mycoplasma haemofelis]CBY93028.1 hypothetical protein HF1_10200 [Mycoplasma haemofelis str. Langford 1]